MDGKELRAQFERPGSAYRGKPFWSWNGELEKGELLRQMDVMEQMGFGGFFIDLIDAKPFISPHKCL